MASTVKEIENEILTCSKLGRMKKRRGIKEGREKEKRKRQYAGMAPGARGIHRY